ncbi:MAG: hypothetical protein V1668_04185 [Patescibacteria group bacterium]
MEEQNQQQLIQTEKPKKKIYKKWWFIILVIIFIVGISGVLLANQSGYLMLFPNDVCNPKFNIYEINSDVTLCTDVHDYSDVIVQKIRSNLKNLSSNSTEYTGILNSWDTPKGRIYASYCSTIKSNKTSFNFIRKVYAITVDPNEFSGTPFKYPCSPIDIEYFNANGEYIASCMETKVGMCRWLSDYNFSNYDYSDGPVVE